MLGSTRYSAAMSAPAPQSMTPDDPSGLAARIASLYPELPLPAVAIETGRANALPTPMQVPANTLLFEETSPCMGFPLVLSGEIRVARGGSGGRSLELYRVGPGEFCVVSASALFGRAAMPAIGATTQATELVLIPAATFEAWTAFEPFRRHVFGLFTERLADVISLAEAVAFHRLDQRLAAALLGRGTVLQATHQSLADELGTVREMVTRLLRRFERAGWLKLGREQVELIDPAALRRVAEGAAIDT